VDCATVQFGRSIYIYFFGFAHPVPVVLHPVFAPQLFVDLINHLPVSPDHILDRENEGSIYPQNVIIYMVLQPRLLQFAQTSY
jgi:hypothetical protein